MGIFDEVFKSIESGDKKVESEFEVFVALQGAIPNGHVLTSEERAEFMAFHLHDTIPDAAKSRVGYFGLDIPNSSALTEEMVGFWRKRIEEVQHPVLRARYIGLVWDAPRLIGGKADESFRHPYIEVMLEGVEGGSYGHHGIVRKLHRLSAIIARYNDSKYFDVLKARIFQSEERFLDDDRPGLWMFAYTILTTNNKVKPSEAELKEIIRRIEERFKRLVERDGAGLPPNPWTAEDVAKKLAEYYTRIGDKTAIRRLLLAVLSAYEPVFKRNPAYMIHGWLEHLHKLFEKYALNDDADNIMRRMRAMGDELVGSLTATEMSVEIPGEVFEEITEQMLSGTIEEVLMKIVGYFIPTLDRAEEDVRRQASESMLQFSFRRIIVGEKGRTKAIIDGIEDDLDGQVVLRIAEIIQFQAVFLHVVLEEGIRRGLLMYENIMAFMDRSALIEANRKALVNRALRYYFEGDFIGFIHVILPQIEQAIRNMVEKLGGSVTRVKDGVTNLRLLNELLADRKVLEFIGLDAQAYLRTLLVDNRGLNARNEGLHGMFAAEVFDKILADLLLHATLLLGMIREQSPEMGGGPAIAADAEAGPDSVGDKDKV